MADLEELAKVERDRYTFEPEINPISTLGKVRVSREAHVTEGQSYSLSQNQPQFTTTFTKDSAQRQKDH